MRDGETRPKHLESCLDEIAKFRANMKMLEGAIRQEREELLRLERTSPPPEHPDRRAHEDQIDKKARDLAEHEALLSHVAPELEALLRQCRETEAGAPDTERDEAALHSSLRTTIDDPRYWRDGDPALAQSVSDGFKRLYPDD